jgi:hypothetical protein
VIAVRAVSAATTNTEVEVIGFAVGSARATVVRIGLGIDTHPLAVGFPHRHANACSVKAALIGSAACSSAGRLPSRARLTSTIHTVLLGRRANVLTIAAVVRVRSEVNALSCT